MLDWLCPMGMLSGQNLLAYVVGALYRQAAFGASAAKRLCILISVAATAPHVMCSAGRNLSLLSFPTAASWCMACGPLGRECSRVGATP